MILINYAFKKYYSQTCVAPSIASFVFQSCDKQLIFQISFGLPLFCLILHSN